MFVFALESNMSRAMHIGEFEMYSGDANLLNQEADRYSAVTLDDVKRVAKQYFADDQPHRTRRTARQDGRGAHEQWRAGQASADRSAERQETGGRRRREQTMMRSNIAAVWALPFALFTVSLCACAGGATEAPPPTTPASASTTTVAVEKVPAAEEAPPAPAPPPAVHFPQVARSQTKAGLELDTVALRQLPIVQIRLVIKQRQRRRSERPAGSGSADRGDAQGGHDQAQ